MTSILQIGFEEPLQKWPSKMAKFREIFWNFVNKIEKCREMAKILEEKKPCSAPIGGSNRPGTWFFFEKSAFF